MPRKVYRKRRTYKKKATLTRKVNKLAKIVKARAPEVKYSWNYGLMTIDNLPSGFILPYRQISVGTSDLNNRIGDDIYIKSFRVRGWLALPAATAATMVRIVAFLFKNNADAATTSTATIINWYLESTNMNTYQAPLSIKDWDNSKGFTTLCDKLVPVNPSDSAVNYVRPLSFSLKMPTTSRKVEYANGGIYPTRNELIICAIADTDTSVQWAYTYQMTYTDN